MYARTPFWALLGLAVAFLLMTSSAMAGDRTCEDRTVRLLQLRSGNQFAHGANTGVVLPHPQLDVLYGDETCGPDWTAIRRKRVQELISNALDRIHFDFDSSALDAEALEVVDLLVGILNFNQDVGLNLTCHTDLMGSDEYNAALSVRRCTSVLAALEQRGIDATRLGHVTPMGETTPLINVQAKERMNRRVEGTIFDTLAR